MAVRDCPANAPVDAKICHLSKHGGRDLLVEIWGPVSVDRRLVQSLESD